MNQNIASIAGQIVRNVADLYADRITHAEFRARQGIAWRAAESCGAVMVVGALASCVGANDYALAAEVGR